MRGQPLTADVVICGAGIAGVATARALTVTHGVSDVLLVDPHPPLSQTSARSGENYRNWWPHPTMARLMNRSIALMEDLARASGNMFQMHRRGYLYVTLDRDAKATLPGTLLRHSRLDVGALRIRAAGDSGEGEPYRSTPVSFDTPLDGADLLLDTDLVRAAFPQLSENVQAALHVRRAGGVSAQQLGALLLDQARARGARLHEGEVVGVTRDDRGVAGVEILSAGVSRRWGTRRLVNAAGPWAPRVAALLGVTLPVTNVFQQKIAIRDPLHAIPRDAPFTILLDGQRLDWSAEERREWWSDPRLRWMLGRLPGGLHVRPEGGADSEWIKLGWAFNREPEEPVGERPGAVEFPEVVLRGAARMVPGLQPYVGRIPTPVVHYGGYYTKAPDDLPLVGPLDVDGAYLVGALAGYGTMAACAVGELAAAWTAESALPDYAQDLAITRLHDPAYVAALRSGDDRGEL